MVASDAIKLLAVLELVSRSLNAKPKKSTFKT